MLAFASQKHSSNVSVPVGLDRVKDKVDSLVHCVFYHWNKEFWKPQVVNEKLKG